MNRFLDIVTTNKLIKFGINAATKTRATYVSKLEIIISVEETENLT